MLVFFVSGCDFFATSAFTSKPISSSEFVLAQPGGQLRYRVTEALWEAGKSPVQFLPDRELILTRSGDTLIDGALHWMVTDSSFWANDDIAPEKKILLVFPSAKGLLYKYVGEDEYFHSLPPVFFAGAGWSASYGELDTDREIVGTDTLEFRGGLEEVWVVEESRRDEGSLLATGIYHYGMSGLLRAELRWPAIPWRSESGANLGQVELRRNIRLL